MRPLRLSLLGFALSALLALGSPPPTDAGWIVPPGSPSDGARLEDVFFRSANLGYVIHFQGDFYRTTNGGTNWFLVPDTPGFLYRSLAFATQHRGWIGTLDSSKPLLATTDGGDTWATVPGLTPALEGVCGMWVVNDQVIYGCGTYNGPARLVKTTNGGTNWQVIDMSAIAGTAVDCYFPTPTRGFVVGGIGPFGSSTRAGVWETTNGGATWRTRHVGSRQGEWCWKISFPSANVGYVSVEGQGSPQEIVLKTTNGGFTWTELPSVWNVDQQGICFLDDMNGWVGGWGGTTSRTTDGGLTWSPDPWGTNVNSFFRLSPTIAYAVGMQFHKYDAVVSVDSEPALLTGRDELETRVLGSPFRESTAIVYRLDEPGPVRCSIFSSEGRLVRTLRDGWSAAGAQRAVWDARDALGREVAPGVYLYRVTSGARAGGGKITRVR